MSYDINAHREAEVRHCLRLVREGGPGWHDYVIDKARRLRREDAGVHGDLPATVQAAINETSPQRAGTQRRH